SRARCPPCPRVFARAGARPRRRRHSDRGRQERGQGALVHDSDREPGDPTAEGRVRETVSRHRTAICTCRGSPDGSEDPDGGGGIQADLLDGISNMVPLKRAGIVAPFVPASAALIPPDLKDKDGHWIAILLYVFSPGINTTLVSRERAPKTYADLLDPAWRDK